MMTKQKLELTWIGKEKRPKLEPRILLEELEKSYHAKHWVTENDIGTKPWKYLLPPHDEIAESKRLPDYSRFEVKAV